MRGMEKVGPWPAQYYVEQRRQRSSRKWYTCLRPSALGVSIAVVGRIVVAPLLLIAACLATNYFTSATFFIPAEENYFAYSELDPVMRGGCTGCVCSCRKVLLQLSAFGNESIMNKPKYEGLQAMASEAVAAGDYSGLTPEAIVLADQLDVKGAVCSTGVNDWGTPNVVFADEPQGILDVVATLGLNVPLQNVRELEVAHERKDECVSRWNIAVLLRRHRFQTVQNGTDYASIPIADVNIFPHYTDCRPDIPNEGLVGAKLMLPTYGEDPLAAVPDSLKLFPYEFSGSSLPAITRYVPTKQTTHGAFVVTQALFRSYYGGCRVRIVNTTGIYVEDTCELSEHWKAYGLMLQAPDDLPVCSTGEVCIHNLYSTMVEHTSDLNEANPARLDQIINVFRSRYADAVSLSSLPAIVVCQILFMGIVNFYHVMAHRRSVLLAQVWAYRSQNGHMQPVYLAEITYHFLYNSNLYYLGLSTGTLSRASVLNLVLSFFAFAYSLVNLVKARTGKQLLHRRFRLLWEAVLLVATIALAGVLLSMRLTSLSWIGDMNGELLRRTSEKGAKYCGLIDSCFVFTVNLGFVVAVMAIALGLVVTITAWLAGTGAMLCAKSNRVDSNQVQSLTSSSFRSSELTSFEHNCLGGSLSRLFADCHDVTYVAYMGKRCVTVEMLFLTGYMFHGKHVYQATSVLLLLAARVVPHSVLCTFNILLLRWYVDPVQGTLSHALSCIWHMASAEKGAITEPTPVA